jgi:hypothetical protein
METIVSSTSQASYLRFIKAGLQDQDSAFHIDEIAELPLEKRYVWQVASALKWAFADLETVSVEADRNTLSEDDLRKVVELLPLRPMQFCIFLKALLAAEAMERLVSNAVAAAKNAEG